MKNTLPPPRSPLPLAAFACVLLTALAAPSAAHARVKLESICSLYGQKPLRLTGVGLVVGLRGTGDGKGAAPTVEALARTLDLLGNPVAQSSLRDADNVAIVLLEATIPAEALRVGQSIDVHCSSVLSAESLRGGRLLVAPLQSADRRSQVVVATASGGVAVEDEAVQTTGRIPGGAIIEADLFEERQFLANVLTQDEVGYRFALLLEPNHAGFTSANTVAAAVNADFRESYYDKDVARAVGPGMVEVRIPAAYENSPVEFIGEVMEVGIDRPHEQARVIVNTRSNTLVITGEAEISPALISHPGIQLEIGPSFRTLTDPQQAVPNAQLRQLVAALGQLQVSSQDVIAIVRELHASGKLHAQYEER